MPRVFHASSDWFAAGHLLFRTGIVGSAGKAVKDFLHYKLEIEAPALVADVARIQIVASWFPEFWRIQPHMIQSRQGLLRQILV